MEALGRLTAQYHHRDRVLVLLTGGKDAALEQAFLRGFHEEALSTGATCDTLRVSERFASGTAPSCTAATSSLADRVRSYINRNRPLIMPRAMNTDFKK